MWNHIAEMLRAFGPLLGYALETFERLQREPKILSRVVNMALRNDPSAQILEKVRAPCVCRLAGSRIGGAAAQALPYGIPAVASS